MNKALIGGVYLIAECNVKCSETASTTVTQAFGPLAEGDARSLRKVLDECLQWSGEAQKVGVENMKTPADSYGKEAIKWKNNGFTPSLVNNEAMLLSAYYVVAATENGKVFKCDTLTEAYRLARW